MTESPLVPHFILQQHASKKTSGVFPAAVQFVDISGFSSLTEKLIAHGKEGAEVLGTTLRFFFNPLIEAVEQAGGFITGFAGDSFTAVYPDREEADFGQRLLFSTLQSFLWCPVFD